MIVGITGKYCSGKSTLSRIFVECGYEEINVDAIGHEALKVKSNEVISLFGDDIVDDNNLDKTPTIDRRKLGNKVFSNVKQLEKLENIVHPWMKQEIQKRLSFEPKTNSHEVTCKKVICATLLHKMKLDSLCDVIILVKTNWLRRFIRAYKRDALSFSQIIKRFSTQNHIPTKKTLKKHFATSEAICIRGIYSKATYKKQLQHYLL